MEGALGTPAGCHANQNATTTMNKAVSGLTFMSRLQVICWPGIAVSCARMRCEVVRLCA